MIKAIRCFVSYSHQDTEPKKIACLLEWLKELSENKLEFIFDTSLVAGDNINQFMSGIKNVDCIIMLLTPSYKAKIENNIIASGVYKEFNLILDKYYEVQKLKEGFSESYDDENVYIMPLLYSGSGINSVPGQLNELVYEDITKCVVVQDNKDNCYIPANIKKAYEPIFMKIISNAIGIASRKSSLYKKTKEEIFDALFFNTKAEDIPDLPIKLFVKTFSYNAINSQEAYFIIGRKGSGKSTVTTTMSRINGERYKGIVRIVADEFDLEQTFAYFKSSSYSKDIEEILSLSNTLEILWSSFIYLYSAYIIYKEYQSNKLSGWQKQFMGPIKDKIEGILATVGGNDKSDDGRITKALYTYCLENLFNFTDVIIKKSRDSKEFFIPDIINMFTLNRYKEYIFGETVLKNLTQILNSCRRRILITLDGFDRRFEQFRINTVRVYSKNHEMHAQRNNFETLWLSSLLEVLSRIKLSRNDALYQLIDLCITIPKDRYTDIKDCGRDFFKLRGKFVSLNWSGVELAIMLRKRLEYLEKAETPEDLPPEQRLNRVLAEKFPQIPEYIEIKIDDNDYQIPIFQYIMSLSFWRPRDILTYFANILCLTYDISTKKNSGKLDSAIVKRIIKETSINVIKDEFINEFSSVFLNIDEVILRFKRCKHFLTYNELFGILNSISLCIHDCSKELSLREKFEMLYEIGFLGLRVTDEYKEKHSLWHNHVFVFNEGKIPLRGFDSDEFKACHFIIHPIFREYLSLEINTKEIICSYDWKYLHDIELVMRRIEFV